MVLNNSGASERQYFDLVADIRDNGFDSMDRTGVGTRAVHGRTVRFDLSDGSIPLLTTKRVPIKAVVHELLWFLRGETNIQSLVQNNVHIWSDWPHAAYVQKTGDSIAMDAFERRVATDDAFAAQWGDLGPVYGKNWRRWEGPDGRIYDQISDMMARLQRDPTSRRLLFHGWNVADIDQMMLPPCHLLYQLFSRNNRLSMTLYQRSCDVALGLPFNLASAAFLLRMIAHQSGQEPGELFWVGHDVHLYLNHIEPIQQQLVRTPRAFPTLSFNRMPENLFDYKLDDFNVQGYTPDPSISMPVAV